jgi:hypothetical protein
MRRRRFVESTGGCQPFLERAPAWTRPPGSSRPKQKSALSALTSAAGSPTGTNRRGPPGFTRRHAARRSSDCLRDCPPPTVGALDERSFSMTPDCYRSTAPLRRRSSTGSPTLRYSPDGKSCASRLPFGATSSARCWGSLRADPIRWPLGGDAGSVARAARSSLETHPAWRSQSLQSSYWL